MAFKFVIAFAFVAVVSAGYIPSQQVYHAAPVAQAVAVAQPALTKRVEEYDPHPQYKYAYDVHDAVTGDVKSQVETRDGDVVQGEYSLIDADGYKRIVQYTADAVHGFNAVVTRVPLNVAVKEVHAAPAIIKASPVTYAAPSVVKSVVPVAYAAPSYVKATPVVKAVAYSAPPAYGATPVFKSAPVAYASPSYYKSSPVAIAAPAFVKSTPVAYTTSESYSAPAYLKSAPVSYGYNH